MQEETQVPVDALKAHYFSLKDKLITESEILEKIGDITELFFLGLRQKLIKNENLSIVIKGQTSKGKSSLGLMVKNIINDMILELGQKTTYTNHDDMAFDLVSANQIEFLRIARRKDLFNVCTLIDEFSAMGKTGIDSTVESSYLVWYDQVAAQKFLHRIYCTPNNDYDSYAFLILEIIDIDKPKRITIAKVYYNDPSSSTRKICLGTITLELGDMFEKQWYIKYRTKKFFAINLLLNNTIRDVRELEFALVKLMTYKKCLRLAEMGHTDSNLTTNKIKESTRDIGGVHSIIGEIVLKNDTQGLLELVAQKYKKTHELNRNDRRKPLTKEETEELEEQIKIYTEEIQKEIGHSKELIKLYLEYMSIGNKYYKDKLLETLKKYDIQITEKDEKEEE